MESKVVAPTHVEHRTFAIEGEAHPDHLPKYEIECDELMSKRVLVTGGGGFISGHLIRKLLDEGHFVRAVDIKPIEEWNQLHEGAENYGNTDLRYRGLFSPDRKHGFNMMTMFDVDWIFHLASDMGGIGEITSRGAEIMFNNMLIDLNVADLARRKSGLRFFYSSSACVYPVYKMLTTDFTPMTEDEAYPADPNEAYGWQKLTTEKLLEEYAKAYGMQVYIARFQNVMGSHCAWDGGREKAPAALCRKVAWAKVNREGAIKDIVEKYNIPSEIEIWGDGEQTRSFMHVTDCVNAIYDLIQTSHHTPITLGPDETCSINELVDMIADEAGITITKKHIPGPEGVRGRHFDHSACKEAIGWVPSTPIREGIGKVYQWVESQVRER